MSIVEILIQPFYTISESLSLCTGETVLTDNTLVSNFILIMILWLQNFVIMLIHKVLGLF